MLTYKRERFATRLPVDRVYTRSHYWLLEVEPAVWRIGFTKFASRMLGDIVEYKFEIESGIASSSARKSAGSRGSKR
jgi:Glycine cleavage system H protein (lipoate-binding)